MKKDAALTFFGWVREVAGDVSTLEIFAEFEEAINGIEMFSHLIVLYWFHERDNLGNRSVLSVTPRRHKDAPEIGVFGSRSPSRPNPIGYCVVELLRRDRNLLVVKGMDALKGSPLIDINPYLPRADAFPDAHTPSWALSGPRS